MHFNDYNRFQKFSNELRFLVDSISIDNDIQKEAVKCHAKVNFDFNVLLSLAERHRLLPLIYKEIQKNSPEFSSTLPIEFIIKTNEQLNRSLSLAGEGIRLSEMLHQASIPVLFIKGFPLSLQFYNDIAVRPSRDIDILINPADFSKVHEILSSNGYIMNYPNQSVSVKQLQYHQKFKHEASYRNPQQGVLVEVHWRLLTYAIPPNERVENIMERSQEIVIANRPIRVMSDSDNFRYLCEHGAWHQWYRLLWLRDIAQFSKLKGDLIIEYLEKLFTTKSERPAIQAIYLSNIFFKSHLPKEVEQNITPLIHSLTDWGIQSIEAEEKAIQSRGFSRIRRSIQRMKFHPSLSYKFKCWNILQPNSQDWTLVRLPDFLFFLYYPLRPILWFYSAYLKRPNQSKIK